MSDILKSHAKLSPSAAHRWLVCPGEPSARAQSPSSSSSYADAGTAAHWVAEQCLHGDNIGLTLDPFSWVGRTITDPFGPLHRGILFTKELARIVRLYLDYVRPIFALAYPGATGIEVKVRLHSYSPDLDGTADAVAIGGDTLVVADLKTGFNDVPIYDNEQLLIYALGALVRIINDQPELADKIKNVTLAIIQPPTSDEPKEWTVTRDYLLAWGENVLKPAVFRAANEPHIRVAGDHCGWCPAKASCPTLHQLGESVAMTVFSPVGSPAIPTPEQIPLEKIITILRHKDVVEKWLASLEGHVYNLLMLGQNVPGFKLVKKRANREWVSGGEAAEALYQVLGDDIYLPRKLISPKQAEDLLGDRDLKLNKTLVTQPDNGLTVAEDGDRRKAVPPPTVFLPYQGEGGD